MRERAREPDVGAERRDVVCDAAGKGGWSGQGALGGEHVVLTTGYNPGAAVRVSGAGDRKQEVLLKEGHGAYFKVDQGTSNYG